MDGDSGPRSRQLFPHHDLMEDLCQSVPEDVRQGFDEKVATDAIQLAQTLGAASKISTAIAISSRTGSNADQSFQEILKPVPCSPVPLLNTIRPSLKDLVCYAVPRVAAVWYDVGLQLDLEPDVLEEIEKEKSDQPRKMFAKWLQGSSCSWQNVLNAVEKIRGKKPMDDIQADVLVSVRSAQSSELTRKRRRSSTQSSEDLELQQLVAKKSCPDYTAIKTDLFAQDISDLHSESDPEVVIKLLYGNALATVSDLLEPHLNAVKKAACRFHRLGVHPVAVCEDIIQSAHSIDSLMSLMSVGGMWYQTHFLRKAIASIPHAAPERGIAEAILSHYHLHLAIFKRSTPLKDALTKESESEEKVKAPTEANKLVPLKITSSKAFHSFSCEDCHILQVQLLEKAYGIPEEKIICRKVEDGRSTTITFCIPRRCIQDVIKCSARLDTVWILLELNIMEVFIPEMFTFIPSVGCFLSLLRGSGSFTADLLGVTEALPYQMYCLLDSDIKGPLSGQPLSVKRRIEQHWDSHDAFSLPDAKSEDDATQAMLATCAPVLNTPDYQIREVSYTVRMTMVRGHAQQSVTLPYKEPIDRLLDELERLAGPLSRVRTAIGVVNGAVLKNRKLSRRKKLCLTYKVWQEKNGYTVGKAVVVKFSPWEAESDSWSDVGQEYEIQHIVKKYSSIPVAEVLHLSTAAEKEIVGAKFMVMKFVEGVNYETVSDIPREKMKTVLFNAVQALANVHRYHWVRHYGSGLEFKMDCERYWEMMVQIWFRNYKAAIENDASHCSMKLYRKMEEGRKPSRSDMCLVHGDFNISNLIFNEQCEVVAILDWKVYENADPLSDVAYFMMVFLQPRDYGQHYKQLSRFLLGPPDECIPSEETALEWYRGASSHEFTDSDYRFAKAVSCLRLISVFKAASDDNFEGHESAACPAISSMPRMAVQILTIAGLSFIETWSYVSLQSNKP